MKKSKVKLACLSMLVGMLMLGDLFAEDIPTISNFSAVSGPYAGTVVLDWNTPSFNDSNSAVECSYEFRYDAAEVNAATWETSAVFVGDIPPILIEGGAELDLYVQCDNDGNTIYWDRAYLRAFLNRTGGLTGPWLADLSGGRVPLCGEPITFTVYNSQGTVVAGPVTANTGSWLSMKAGMAEWTTGDLTSYSCSSPGYPNFKFEAYWPGGSVGLVGGNVSNAKALTDTKHMQLCDGTSPIISGQWTGAGGTFDYSMGGVDYQCIVPAGAVGFDVNVSIANPVYVPESNGMGYAVPGAMVAFQLDAEGDPNLDLPIAISVNYPSYKLEEYGGLGESSLRGYIYDDVNELWVMLDDTPTIINRQIQCVTFGTDRLGLFAIAAETDEDSDGLGDYEELARGTNPTLADSDGDGVSDGDEVWFTGGDPHDIRKVNGEDQYAVVRGLVPGQNYYVAARIVGYQKQSEVSNCVYVQAADCPANPDLDCSGIVDLNDFALLALWWLESYP